MQGAPSPAKCFVLKKVLPFVAGRVAGESRPWGSGTAEQSWQWLKAHEHPPGSPSSLSSRPFPCKKTAVWLLPQLQGGGQG